MPTYLKQQKISNWVDDTERQPPANPFTPATPAVHALQIRREEEDNRHRRKDSKDYRDGHREGRDPNRVIDHLSTCQQSVHRPGGNGRPIIIPLLAQPRLRIQPSCLATPTTSERSPPSPTHGYYAYVPKLMSPRDSKHSSRTSSSTWLPENLHYVQPTPHSAPVIPRNMRSQTTLPNCLPPLQQPAACQGAPGYLPVKSIPLLACPHCPDPQICLLAERSTIFPFLLST